MNSSKPFGIFVVSTIAAVIVVVILIFLVLFLTRSERVYDFKDFKGCHFANPKTWFAVSKTSEDVPKARQHLVEGGIKKVFTNEFLIKSTDFLTIGKGQHFIAIRTSQIKEFHKALILSCPPLKTFPFVLVCVNCDYGPSNFEKEVREILDHPSLIKMYCQNLDIIIISENNNNNNNKLEPFPIGVDFHTIFFGDVASFKWESWFSRKSPRTQENELIKMKNSLPHPSERPPLAYTSATLNMTDSVSKANHAFGGIRNELKKRQSEFRGIIEFQNTQIKRLDTWKKHGDFLFIVSPPGKGLDCHRTWEALALGNVPILFNTPPFTNSTLFDDLPVVIVDSLSEITLENMKKWKDEFVDGLKTSRYKYEKLTVKYWEDKIKKDK